MAKSLNDFKAKYDPQTIIAGLQAELKQAQSQAATAEALRELLGTAKLELEKFDLPAWAVQPKKSGCPGVPTVQLSDLHWGEVVKASQIGGVNSYNLSIARRRLRTVAEGAIKIARMLDPKMRYPGVFVPLVGDMISGNIHEELTATNEINTMPTVLDLYKHLVPAIKMFADAFGIVVLPCVTGNHGRDTKKTWAKDRTHTSFDWLLYQFLAIAFADDDRVTFYIPDGSDGIYRIYNTRYAITHGDQFRAGDSIIGPIGPIMRGDQKKRARNQAIGQEYDVLVYGHWHRRMIDYGLRGNSTTKGYDEYAAQNNYRFEPPSQNFWITHIDRGITFDVPLFCEDTSRNRKASWAAVQR